MKFNEAFAEPVELTDGYKSTCVVSMEAFSTRESARIAFEQYFDHPINLEKIGRGYMRYQFLPEELSDIGIPGVDSAWILSNSGKKVWTLEL